MVKTKIVKGKQDAATSEQTRVTIIHAAMVEFSQKGYAAASLREIARQAETTHGLIRHHFGAKQDLWCAMVDKFVATMTAKHQPLLAQKDQSDPVELLKGFVTNFINLSAGTPQVARIILLDCSRSGPQLDYLHQRILPLHKSITPVFKAAQNQGFLQQFDADSFFIFLLNLGAFPFAMADFSNRFSRQDIQSKAGLKHHTQLVVKTLFG